MGSSQDEAEQILYTKLNTDDQLFNETVTNSMHVLHSVLPPTSLV